ncbi:hypothetical protein BNJ_00048 [Kaumoebavirus]|uniref:hypothetical protein n=1 Tax=Kaumoebavirus TaxID=1859492 RepID=UPI0009C3CB92|nr:hypothetical protein BNJ_00048 [Kaumoebavirus]ARA71891.1 hypothetical protein BNJ_00048 [Kaumoebavirus]
MRQLLIIFYTIALIFAIIGMVSSLFSGSFILSFFGLLTFGLTAALYGSTVHYLKTCPQ